MTEDQFWAMIEQAKNVPDDEKVDLIKSHLHQLSTEELVAFDLLFDKFMAQSYQIPLWGAAYIIHGGCSDDGFDYFRAWLICQGRTVYQNAVTNPDWLAEYVNPDRDYYELEEALSMAHHVYEEQTDGEDLPLPPPEFDPAAAQGPAGEDWDFDDEDECRRRLPRLSALFLTEDDE